MYTRRVIPSGRRGLPTPLTQAEKDDIANAVPTSQDARLDALENPVIDGTRSIIGAHIGTANQLGTPQRIIRFNCELDVSEAVMLSLAVEGNAYAVGDIIASRFTGYWTGSTLAFGAAADLTGGARPAGVGISPNGKPYFWFEAHNHLTTFTVDAMRHPLGGVIPKGSMNLQLTEAGVAWT